MFRDNLFWGKMGTIYKVICDIGGGWVYVPHFFPYEQVGNETFKREGRNAIYVCKRSRMHPEMQCLLQSKQTLQKVNLSVSTQEWREVKPKARTSGQTEWEDAGIFIPFLLR